MDKVDIDIRRLILIVVVIILLFIFYQIGKIDSSATTSNTSTANTKPEVFAVDLPPGFFDKVYPDFETSDTNGFLLDKTGAFIRASVMGLPFATKDQVYKAANAVSFKTAAIGAQFIGWGLFGEDTLQIGYPRQQMIDNIGLINNTAQFNSTIPGVFLSYNSKTRPTTAILYAVKPGEGEKYKIAGTECTVHPWYRPDQSDINTKPIWSQIVQ